MPDIATKKMPKSIEKFLYVESSQVPLQPIPYEDLKQTIIDPTTGQPYKGMVLKGCFADLSNKVANNNKRFYDVPRYLELVQILKKQVHSAKGVYGEYEHPKSYAVYGPNISHKIIDIWYDETDKKVYGIVIILNTPRGKIAQEVIRSGGRLAISARAAGEELTNADGTKQAITKLLTTFDLVYHPGFSEAILDFVELNESMKFNLNEGFNGIIYDKDLRKIDFHYTKFVKLTESAEDGPCFYQWLLESEELLQNDDQEEQQEILEQNQTNDQDQVEDKLEKATDDNLAESKSNALKQMYSEQQKLKINVADKSVYDNSAGFIDAEP